jgi:predicted esterase
LVLRGHDDPWYTVEKFDADRVALERLGVDLCALEYPQAHEWPREWPAAAVEFLRARLA